MPWKGRRLNAACQFEATDLPGLSNALRLAFADRVFLLEHESIPASAKAVASARVRQTWVSWQRLNKPQSHRPATR